MIDEVFAFLSENVPVYLATVEGDEARVRPVGFVAIHEGKLLFATRRESNLYRQLQDNPSIEISTTNKDREWVRIKAVAELITDNATKRKLLDARPALKRLSAEPDGLGAYYAADAIATFCSMTDAPRVVKL
jgi:uncharacterized pyridoxamine 5'-phosphate oxidase family protein